MAEVQQALFGLVCAVAGGTLTLTWVALFRPAKRKTVLVPVAKRVEGRIMPNYSREQRRANKRRPR